MSDFGPCGGQRMLSIRKGWFRIACGLFVLGIACLALPPYQQYCEDDHSNQYGCTAYEVAMAFGEFVSHHDAAITALATIAIAAFTYTLYATSIEQARLTREAIKLARDEFISTHRPRVIVRFIQGDFGEGGRIIISVVVVNIGVSRAIVQGFGADVERRKGKTSLTPGADGAVNDIDPIRLVSGQRHSFRVDAKPSREVSDMSLDAADAEADITIRAIGAIRYIDDNCVVRETGFCRTWDGERFIASKNTDDEYQD